MNYNLHRFSCALALLLTMVSCHKDNDRPVPPTPTPPPPAPSASQPVCDNSNRTVVSARLVQIGELSQARVGMATVAAGNKVFFAGASLKEVNQYGSSRVDIFDASTQTWTKAELSEARSDIAAIAAGEKVFFAGGRLGDGAFDQLFSTVDIYNIETNTWSVATLSQPRAYIAAAAVGNKVLFAGGEKDVDYNTSTVVDIYDLTTGRWSVAHLSEERAYISAITNNNKVYFAGGHKEDRWYKAPSKTIDVYDAATNTWSATSLATPMGFVSGSTLGDIIFWVSHCTVEIKDLQTGTSTNAFLRAPGTWITVKGQQPALKDNKIIFFRHDYSNDNTQFDIYDIATQTWAVGTLSEKVRGASIISVNNTIYLAGGAGATTTRNEVWKLEF